MGTRLATAVRNAMAEAAAVTQMALGAGTAQIKVYTGSQPATPNTAVSGTLLATFNLAAPAFGSASTGVCTLNGTPITTTGAAAGDAGWFRVLNENGDAMWDGTCTVTGGGGQLQLNTVTISVGVDVQITSGSFTMPLGS